MNKQIDVIIATTAEKKRELQLRRAVESVKRQTYKNYDLKIIVNGSLYDEELVQWIKQNATYYYMKEGCYVGALKYARTVVSGDFFCFLDDDDELTAHSLAERVKLFNDSSKDVSLVVGNGVRVLDGTTAEIITEEKWKNISDSPEHALFKPRGNWLASCAGLYRTSKVTTKYFVNMPKFAEWSHLAVSVLFDDLVIHFTRKQCYVIHTTSHSLSSSLDYLLGQYNFLSNIDARARGKVTQRLLAKKTSDMSHELADIYFQKGEKRTSVYFHLKSLTTLRGLFKYIMASRRYIF